MADYVLGSAPYQNVNSSYKRAGFMVVVATAGSGDGTLTISETASAPGFTITGSAGDYAGTCPIGTRAVAFGQAVQATPDGAVVVFQTLDPVAGTFTFETHHGDTTSGAEALADGDAVWLLFIGEGG